MKNLASILIIVLFLASCVSNSENEEQTNNEKKDKTEANVSSSENEEQVNNEIKDTTEAKIEKPQDKRVLISVSIEDRAKFIDLMNYAILNDLSDKSFSEIEIEIAKELLNTPYVASTLEKDSIEQLVVNLRGLDCTTFVENVVAFSQSVKANNSDLKNYCNNLIKIRYRDGKIDNYTSRLHYFTDWLLNNEKKGIIEIISNKYGDADFDSKVDFMSNHPTKYKHLKNHPEFVKTIAQYEDTISNAKLKYFTPEGLKKNYDKIQNGDIIAFATSLDGLDISHVAIACFKGKDLHFYHASSAKKKVVLSEIPMVDYVNKSKSNYGVLVARVIKIN